MSTTPPNQPPFDPTNVNDPRYDPSRDPRYDPRWQKAQQRFYRDQQRAMDGQARAAGRAQTAAWKAQMKAQRQQEKMYWRAQRRTSIVGPVLLVSIGVIFLLVHLGRISPYGLGTWFGRWWPLLLILVGVLRLAEWAIDRSRTPEGAPPMRYSMGGGVITLLIIVAVLGLASRSMFWHDGHGVGFVGPWGSDNMEHFFGQKHEEDSPMIVRDLAPNGSLVVDSPHGDVSITGTSDDGKLHLSVHKAVYTNSDDAAARRLGELTPTFDGSGDSLTLRIPSTQSSDVDVTLLVPASTRVLLNSNRGDVHASNLKAPLTVTANNGDVDVAGITGGVQVHINNRRHDVSVHSVSGDVMIEGNGNEVTLTDVSGEARINGDFFGGGHLQRIGGGVIYHSSRTDLSFTHLYGDFEIDGDDLQATEVVGPAMVQTRSRNITLNKVTGDVRVVNNHGDVRIDGAPPIGSITVDNQNGAVEVVLPERAKFSLQAETTDGDTHSDFPGIDGDGRGTLRGSANGGGVPVRINTSHGDVKISHNGSLPLMAPPAPPRLSGVPTPPMPPTPPEINAMQRDALKIAADALKQSADEIDRSKLETSDAKQRAKEAMEQARQAIKDAQEKQKEAMRLTREAAKQR